jgi:hypothetical protein
LAERFGLEDTTPGETEPASVSKIIIPVTDVDKVARDADVYTTGSVSLTGTGAQTLFTMTADEEWTILAYDIGRVSGDRTVDTVYLRDPDNHPCVIRGQTASAVAREVVNNGMRITRGWVIRINLTGGSTDGDWTLAMVVERTKLKVA